MQQGIVPPLLSPFTLRSSNFSARRVRPERAKASEATSKRNYRTESSLLISSFVPHSILSFDRIVFADNPFAYRPSKHIASSFQILIASLFRDIFRLPAVAFNRSPICGLTGIGLIERVQLDHRAKLEDTVFAQRENRFSEIVISAFVRSYYQTEIVTLRELRAMIFNILHDRLNSA